MMRHRNLTIAVLAADSVGVGSLVATTLAQTPDDAPQEVRHKGPPDLGDGDFEVVEVPEGLTARGSVELQLTHGTVTVPQGYGITWGVGDTACGYGLEVWMPGGTLVCFDEDRAEVEVRRKHPADKALVDQLLASATDYRVRPSVVTGETP